MKHVGVFFKFLLNADMRRFSFAEYSCENGTIIYFGVFFISNA